LLALAHNFELQTDGFGSPLGRAARSERQ
jgi:hypothetical protein